MRVEYRNLAVDEAANTIRNMDETRISQPHKTFLSLLNANRVEYLLVGGFAVRYYGYLRPTQDLDLWISTHRWNAKKLIQTCQTFGGGVVGLPSDAFQQERRIICIDIPPVTLEILDPVPGQKPEVLARLNSGRTERIEILTVQSGVNFNECFMRRVEAVIDGAAMSIISLADLKVIKQAGAREQDLIDLAHLP
jgi:hypothetical protein